MGATLQQMKDQSKWAWRCEFERWFDRDLQNTAIRLGLLVSMWWW